MRTNQKVARVFLTSRIRQFLVAVLSVTFGISMYIFMNSFMAGVNAEQTEITFTAMSHIKIHNELSDEVTVILPPTDEHTVQFVNNARNIRYTEGIKNIDALKEEVQRVDGVTGVAAQFNQNVFIRNGVSQRSANLSGIEPTAEHQLFGSADLLVAGAWEDLEKYSNGVILGTGLARMLGVQTGNNVTITTSGGVSKSLKVIGLIETGATSADRSRAIVNIQTARQLFSKNKSYATELMVNVSDYNDAAKVAEQLAPFTEYQVEPWQKGNSQLESANVLRDIIAIAVSLTILLVAGFGIYNIMNMTVNEKIKEIAILKAMGFNGGDVVEIFLTQSIIIGFAGGLVGLGLGNIIVQIVDNIPFDLGPVTTLPVVYRWTDYVLALSFGLIITFLAGYLPAKKAAQLDPVAILRG